MKSPPTPGRALANPEIHPVYRHLHRLRRRPLWPRRLRSYQQNCYGRQLQDPWHQHRLDAKVHSRQLLLDGGLHHGRGRHPQQPQLLADVHLRCGQLNHRRAGALEARHGPRGAGGGTIDRYAAPLTLGTRYARSLEHVSWPSITQFNAVTYDEWGSDLGELTRTCRGHHTAALNDHPKQGTHSFYSWLATPGNGGCATGRDTFT